MNAIQERLAGRNDTAAVKALADQFGTDAEATRKAVAHVVEALSQRMERNTLSRGGLADLVRAIGDPHHAAYLETRELIGSPMMEADGRAILGHIVGTKDASRGVAARAARASGLPAGTVEDMLPTIAALTMGEVSRAAAGPIDDILRRIPGLDEMIREMGRRENAGGRDGETRGRDRDGPGGTGGWQLPDAQPDFPPGRSGENTGGGAGDSLGGGGSIPEQQPLPIPGELPRRGQRAPSRYDDLSDVVRRGGFRLPKDAPDIPDNIPGGSGGAGGGTLYNILRALVGAILGFQSRGIVGWILRFIIMRWGWRILQGVLGRILGRVVLGR